MKKYFVTATGTDIGKTFITAALSRQLQGQGKSVVALKPVISGFNINKIKNSDTGILLEAQGLPASAKNIDAISPWRFCDAISPDMAAENERRNIDFNELITFCQQKRKADYLFVEGPGGMMTPINKSHTVLDWMAKLDYGVILVSGSYLGTLSHTLTAYKALAAKKLKLHCLIINESTPSPVPPKRIMLTLKRFLPNDLPIYCVTKRNHLNDIKRINV